MRKEIIKIKYFIIALLFAWCLYSFALVVNAQTVTKNYAGMQLTCTLTYSNHKGTGSTSGALVSQGRNRVVVYARDATGQAVALATKNAYATKATATTKKKASAVYANSYHSVVDDLGNMIASPIEQIVLTQY